MGLDNNAHNILWGSKEDNKRGEILEDFLTEHNMLVLNRGDRPTFDNRESQTHIDLPISNKEAYNMKIESWEVLQRQSFSDHKYISFKVGEFTPFQRKYRNFKKAKWIEYKQILEQNPVEVVELLTAQQMARETNDLMCAIKAALDVVCLISPALPYRPMGWWNRDLTFKRERLRVLSRSRKRTDRAQLFKNARNEYSYAIRAAKDKGWRDFVSKANSVKDVANIVKILDNTR